MHKKLLFGLIAAIATTNAYSDQVLTSKKYVDDADAQKVNIAQGVGTNNANVGKTLVVNSSGNLELGTVSADNFVEDSITDGVTNKAPSENAVHDALENKQDTIATDMVDFVNDMGPLPAITTYDTTGGLVANKIGILDQETIAGDEGALTLYSYRGGGYGAEMDNYVPTVRAVADELYIIRNDEMPKSFAWVSSYSTPINNYSTIFSSASNTWPSNRQNYVPTVETFAYGLALKQNKLPAQDTNLIAGQQVVQSGASSVIAPTSTPGVVQQVALWDADSQDSAAWDINDYYGGNTVAERGAIRNSIPTVGAVELISNQIKQKQNKIPAHAANAADSVLTDSTTAGVVQKRAILDMETFGENFNASDLADENTDLHNMIPDAGTVGSAISEVAGSKQDKLGGGSSVAGKVVTATATAGNVTYTAIDGTVTNASGNLVTSGAVYTAVSAKQNKMTCTRWLDTPENPDHTDENCLLWELGN